nr:uncharacterized protein LOC120964036 [Aegilops tauschii subsp. strangulata]
MAALAVVAVSRILQRTGRRCRRRWSWPWLLPTRWRWSSVLPGRPTSEAVPAAAIVVMVTTNEMAVAVGTTKEAAKTCTLPASCRSTPRSSRSPYLTTSQVHLGKSRRERKFKVTIKHATLVSLHQLQVLMVVISTDIPALALYSSSSLPNAEFFTFLVADFFKWRPSEPFDLIFYYTFVSIYLAYLSSWRQFRSPLLIITGSFVHLIRD